MNFNDLYIQRKEDLINAIKELGFIPYFSNSIEGFSIEEHVHPSLWFSDMPGIWEWKGPIIQETKCAYGKFAHNKAMFISKHWFYDFANYRRDGYDFDARFEDHLATYPEQYLYNIIASKHFIRSKEAKAIGGYIKPKGKGKDEWIPRKGFDSTITKLQMKGYVLITDFDYAQDKNGHFYGWGMARYATPENFYGEAFSKKVYARSPQESKERIMKHLKKLLPDTPIRELEYFLQ